MPVGIYKRTPEIRLSLSKAAIKRCSRPEERLRLKRIMERNWKSEKFRKIHAISSSKTMKRLHKDPKFQKRLSRIISKVKKKEMIENWKNPEFAKAVLLANPSKPQKLMFALLLEVIDDDIRLEYHSCGYNLDIALPEKRIDIEVDGRYWHKDRQERDKKRDTVLKSHGWTIFRVNASQTDIRNFVMFFTDRTDIKDITKFY